MTLESFDLNFSMSRVNVFSCMFRKFFPLLLLLAHSASAGDHFLSFVMPCYNCEKWVGPAIESIYQQKNLACDFEIICTDDGSQDGTYRVLLELARKHPEMSVYRHARNLGGGATRNSCVIRSSGDLIFCLDADNILAENSVQKLIDHMEATGCAAVAFGQVKYFLEPLIEKGAFTYQAPEGRYHLKDILQIANSPPSQGNYLYTRRSYNLVGGYPTKWGALDTYTFGFLQLLHGCEIAYLPGTHYWHRQGILSYYIRDAKANLLNMNFYIFMLQFRAIFTEESIRALKAEMVHYNRRGRFQHPYTWILENKVLELR